MISILSKIRQAGGTVGVVNKTLRIEAPPGLLTLADRAVLVENRDTLIRLLAPSNADLEREAIQWVEGLDLAAAEVVVDQARQGWAEVVGTTQEPVIVELEGDDAMVKKMAAAMGVPDPEYDLSAWAEAQLSHVSIEYPTLPEQNAYSEIDPATVIPCVFCGSLELWTDAKGGTHCQHCDGARLQRSQQLLDDAARLRAGRRLTFRVGGKVAPTPSAWPPAHLQLPSTVEGIEQGRPAIARQQNLLDDRGHTDRTVDARPETNAEPELRPGGRLVA